MLTLRQISMRRSTSLNLAASSGYQTERERRGERQRSGQGVCATAHFIFFKAQCFRHRTDDCIVHTWWTPHARIAVSARNGTDDKSTLPDPVALASNFTGHTRG